MAGFAPSRPIKVKDTLKGVFYHEKKLRDEPGDRPEVVVRVVDRIRVELDLAVVEVEVRGVVEADIRVRLIIFAHPISPKLDHGS